jgi:outer membrane protein
MKRFFSVGSLLAAALLAGGIGSADAQAKLGYVNSQKLMAEAPGAAAAQQAFEREIAGYRTQVEALGKELERLQGDFEKQQSTLSEAVRKQRQQEFQQKFTQAQDSVQKLEQKAAQRQQQLGATLQPIMNRVKEAIEAVRKEGGFAMIFDAVNSGMVAADPTLEITDRVLARLRAAGTGSK